MRIVYGITMALSLMMLIGYLSLIRKKEKWLLLLFVSVAVVNVGYFMLSLASSVEFALVANKIAYFGSIFLPTCMLLTIFDLSNIKYNKILPISLAIIGALMFALICTTGYLPWYYKEVSLGYANGATELVKVYGPLHVSYLIYLVLYFATMIGAIVYGVIKKKASSHKHSILMAIVVFGNIGVWGMEQAIDLNFEFLSVSYLMSELLLLGVYWMIQDLEKQILQKRILQGVDVTNEDKISLLLTRLPSGESLTARELEILGAILERKKRREIAEELNISENTVKTHTAHLYDKLNVSGRDELNELLRPGEVEEQQKVVLERQPQTGYFLCKNHPHPKITPNSPYMF